ncbi:hypothetical protein C2845_PM10G09570 [Panicum miliaceum]|uniref:Uncharacterized protein n=1 Tax=Panicum miliaceum TaxID=4540 RepID=A0A3L6PGW4_PANMI|nr:hypothetical protein C2845_PM10G09570 [Panicum miliaceum]
MNARRCCECRHRINGGRGQLFTGGSGRWMPRHRSPRHRRGTPALLLNQGQRPGPSTPAAAASSITTSVSSERTITTSPPAAPRLPTPTPSEEPPRRPLVFRLRRPGCTEFGIRVIPDLTFSVVATAGTAGFGPQAGPSNTGGRPIVNSFAVAGAHPSFTIGTMAARQSAPPFFNSGGPSAAAASAAAASTATDAPGMAPASPSAETDATTSTTPTPARLFGRVAATDRRPGIRRGTWSPAALGLSSDN